MRTHQELDTVMNEVLLDLKRLQREVTMLNTVKVDKDELRYINKKLKNISRALKMEE